MSDDVDEAIAALHQGPLDAFLEGRKALAARLKKAGDKDAAARVAGLVKPTPSAWATNRASATARDAFVDLLHVGVALRRAMKRSLAGRASDVPALQRRQREIVEALVGEATRLLGEASLPASDVVTGRVRQNLVTIGTTGRWGDARAACLSKDLSPLDMAGLAELLLFVDEDAEAEAIAAPSVAETSAATPASRARSDDPDAVELDAEAEAARAAEQRRRRREARREALASELAAAEEAHRAREAEHADLATTAEAARVSAEAARGRASSLGAEADRLEAAAREARAMATSTADEAARREATALGATRERDKAAAEAARSATALEAARDRLARFERDSSE